MTNYNDITLVRSLVNWPFLSIGREYKVAWSRVDGGVVGIFDDEGNIRVLTDEQYEVASEVLQ